MTTPRRTSKQTGRVGLLRPDVAAAIERAWPDGVVEMFFDSEESWFHDVRPKLARAFQRLAGARLLYESEAEDNPPWAGRDADDDFPMELDFSRSYHLFFVGPEGDAFKFEAESETLAEPEFDEDPGGEECGDELETMTVAGWGHTGWAVAVSFIAPFAVIALSDYTVFEDGTVSHPSIEPCAQGDDGKLLNVEEHFRKHHPETLFETLQKLRARIVGILENKGVTVLPGEEWHKTVPWLRGGGDALVGEAVGQPVRVLDAFFYQGI